jgi:hypothetical protein
VFFTAEASPTPLPGYRIEVPGTPCCPEPHHAYSLRLRSGSTLAPSLQSRISGTILKNLWPSRAAKDRQRDGNNTSPLQRIYLTLHTSHGRLYLPIAMGTYVPPLESTLMAIYSPQFQSIIMATHYSPYKSTIMVIYAPPYQSIVMAFWGSIPAHCNGYICSSLQSQYNGYTGTYDPAQL